MRQSIACLAVTLAAAVVSPHARQQPAVPPPDKDAFHLFLLVGQSNMAGRGKVEPEDTVPMARVLAFDKQRTWVPAIDPMHFDKPVAGVGLGRTFAIRVAETRPNITIGLVPAAVGGSPIDAWQPGAFYEPTNSHPWDDAIARIGMARTAGTLKAILWHQGESDSAPPEKRAAYPAKLERLIADLRADLESPDAPFVLGQLGPFREAKVPGNNEMNAILLDFPKSHPNTACTSADGLTDKGDLTHFDAKSLREFGKRYAQAYLKLAASR